MIMHLYRYRKAWLVLAAVIILGGGLSAWGVLSRNSAPSDPTQSAGHDDHNHPSADTTADEVAIRVARTMFTWQPSTDTSSVDAMRRTAADLDEPLRTTTLRMPPQLARPDPRWPSWARSGDIITALPQVTDSTDLSDGRHVTSVTVSQVVQHASGQSTPLDRTSIKLTTVRRGDRWLVAEIEPIGTARTAPADDTKEKGHN